MMDRIELKTRAKKIKMILMDTDGVLTEGKIIFFSGGGEAKAFDVKDGVGIKLAQRVGIKTGIITGRSSEAVTRRAQELGIDELCQGAREKLISYEEIISKHSLKDEEVCFIGDDIIDIPVLKRVGFPVAVADAHKDILSFTAYQTDLKGGQGAVREVIDFIIRAQGKWDQLIKRYSKGESQ
jgi:3-deoxy-D-manno-octulosonate 8-phosphate phosphatase (KDO 8-P phosphatase)